MADVLFVAFVPPLEYTLFMLIPDTFVHEMIALHGPAGRAWLERLPTILAACEQCWELRIGLPFAQLPFHYAAPAVRSDGVGVVVKVCSPTGEFEQEAEALRLFDGHGMVQLFACDAGDEALLLERLEPGTLLRTVEDDEQAISVAATVMQQMWRPAPAQHPFPSVSDWGRGFVRLRRHYNGGCGPFPVALLEEAETLFAELSSSMAPFHG